MHDSDVLKQAVAWMEQGCGVALATVVTTWGSSPRPAGSHLVVNDAGTFVGSVSGGCIEPLVVSEALEVIAEGGVRNIVYGVTDEQAEQVRLSCGGNIRVLIEPAPGMAELKAMAEDRPLTRVVDLNSGEAILINGKGVVGNLTPEDDVMDELYCLHKQGASDAIIADSQTELFVATYTTPRRLIVVGAVHISQMLIPMAAALGFDVTIIEPRPAFTKPEWLNGVRVLSDRTERAIRNLTFDAQTAVVLLAHDPMIDDPVLHAALDSPAYYIGCLGSRRTHAERLQRLFRAGYDSEKTNRIHAPIGLDIGGRSSAEIAISILAEIIAVEHRKS